MTPRNKDDWKKLHQERHPVQERNYEHADGTFSDKPDILIPPEKLGLILTPPEERPALAAVEPLGLVEPPAEIKTTIAGYSSIPENYLYERQPLMDWYSQVGGTCGGYSGAQGGTETFSHYPDTIKVFSGMAMYRACRKAGGVDPDDINGGIQMPWLGKALTTIGRSVREGGKWLPDSLQYGADSTYNIRTPADLRKVAWNNYLAYQGDATLPRMSIQIGIPIYAAFESPKQDANGVYWVYWQTSGWGGLLGGHAMLVTDYSDTIKFTPSSKGSILLPNTWGKDFPPCRMSIESLMKCIQSWGEILVVVSKPAGPVGKLELVEPFTISPGAPKTGDVITAHMKVQNTGAGNWTGKLAIEDMVDGVGKNGFGFSPVLNLAPGEGYSHDPQRPDPLTAGHWRFRGDKNEGGAYTVMGVVEVDVSGNPPPPPPPPADTMTVGEMTLVQDGKTYTTLTDYPSGVIFREKKA